MVHNSPVRHRKSIRLSGYDYSQNGAYFITICVQDRRCLFGKVVDGEMRLNRAGEMVGIWWGKVVKKFSEVTMDTYVVMPNHFHGIIIINTVGAKPCFRPKLYRTFPDKGDYTESPLRIISNTYNGVGKYISWFKRMSTNEYIRNVKQNNWEPFWGRLWQRNYYEHIIRDEKDLDRIRKYIIENPQNWQKDTLYP